MSMQRNPVDRGLNCAILHIANRLFPCGFDVSDTAPDTFEGLREHVSRTGRMLVWSGASDLTMFADREVNYAFRAWHDACHIRVNADFSRDGEWLTWCAQCDDLVALYGARATLRWRDILWCEVLAQFDYADRYGHFPKDQYTFTCDTLRILARDRARLEYFAEWDDAERDERDRIEGIS